MGQTQSIEPNHPALYYFCRYHRDYKEAISHVLSHPDEAAYRDFNFETVLHHLVRHYDPSLDAVKAVCEAFPDALVSTNRFGGRTPLHLAAYCSSCEVVRYLSKESPDSVTLLDSEGFTPLDLAIKFRRKDNAAVILSACCSNLIHTSSINKDTFCYYVDAVVEIMSERGEGEKSHRRQ